MALQVRFISTRPDTSVDFWWGSTDPDILNYCNTIKGFATELNIQHSYIESEDKLSSISTFFVDSVYHWNIMSNKILENIPAMLEKRRDYYTSNNHTLCLEYIDETDNKVVYRNAKVLMTVSSGTF